MRQRTGNAVAYEERGATLVPTPVLEDRDGFWRPWYQTIPIDDRTLEKAELLVGNIIKNNGGIERLKEHYDILNVRVAYVWMYPNGQVCSSIITLKDDTS